MQRCYTKEENLKKRTNERTKVFFRNRPVNQSNIEAEKNRQTMGQWFSQTFTAFGIWQSPLFFPSPNASRVYTYLLHLCKFYFAFAFDIHSKIHLAEQFFFVSALPESPSCSPYCHFYLSKMDFI